MSDTVELKAHIKQMLVENLMLQVKPEEIGDEEVSRGLVCV